jgi:hypothetical protein
VVKIPEVSAVRCWVSTKEGKVTVVEGVGVMKDKELKLEEMESFHTLDGLGEGRVQHPFIYRD